MIDYLKSSAASTATEIQQQGLREHTHTLHALSYPLPSSAIHTRAHFRRRTEEH